VVKIEIDDVLTRIARDVVRTRNVHKEGVKKFKYCVTATTYKRRVTLCGTKLRPSEAL